MEPYTFAIYHYACIGTLFNGEGNREAGLLSERFAILYGPENLNVCGHFYDLELRVRKGESKWPLCLARLCKRVLANS